MLKGVDCRGKMRPGRTVTTSYLEGQAVKHVARLGEHITARSLELVHVPIKCLVVGITACKTLPRTHRVGALHYPVITCTLVAFLTRNSSIDTCTREGYSTLDAQSHAISDLKCSTQLRFALHFK